MKFMDKTLRQLHTEAWLLALTPVMIVFIVVKNLKQIRIKKIKRKPKPKD